MSDLGARFVTGADSRYRDMLRGPRLALSPRKWWGAAPGLGLLMAAAAAAGCGPSRWMALAIPLAVLGLIAADAAVARVVYEELRGNYFVGFGAGWRFVWWRKRTLLMVPMACALFMLVGAGLVALGLAPAWWGAGLLGAITASVFGVGALALAVASLGFVFALFLGPSILATTNEEALEVLGQCLTTTTRRPLAALGVILASGVAMAGVAAVDVALLAGIATGATALVGAEPALWLEGVNPRALDWSALPPDWRPLMAGVGVGVLAHVQATGAAVRTLGYLALRRGIDGERLLDRDDGLPGAPGLELPPGSEVDHAGESAGA